MGSQDEGLIHFYHQRFLSLTLLSCRKGSVFSASRDELEFLGELTQRVLSCKQVW